MISTVLLAALVVGQAQASSPAILIYWEPGMRHPWPPGTKTPELEQTTVEVAVWPSGKMIWRDPRPEWAKRNGKWSLQPGKFFQASVSPAAIKAAMERLRQKATHVPKHWGASIPDSHVTTMRLNGVGWQRDLACTKEPSEANPHGSNYPAWKPGLELWRSIRSEAVQLRPRARKEIPRPRESEWM